MIVTSDTVSAGKPDPEGYLAAASALGIPAGGCLVFEDADAGVRAGLSAGAEVVRIGADYGGTVPGARTTIADYRGAAVRIGAAGMILELPAG